MEIEMDGTEGSSKDHNLEHFESLLAERANIFSDEIVGLEGGI